MSLKTQGQAYKKQLIVEQAASLLAHKPYETVTMDEVAHILGCGKATLYKYFARKDDLFADVVYAELESFAQDLNRECVQEKDTLFAIQKCLVMSFRFFRQHGQLFSSWLHYENHDSTRMELFQKVYRLMDERRRQLEELLRRGIAEGLVYDCDAAALTRIVENIFLSCVFSPLRTESGTGMASARDEDLYVMHRILSRGILTPAAQEEMETREKTGQMLIQEQEEEE